ncbi:MAG: DNA-directed RNA polymerase subunit alpha [Fimbriimonadaceae bacterium]|nr:DNA-directed RNA polymerase subunit alpha [Fimbriimonadaceae bacterium]QYK56777.1 MAG: DNA-directed RNA polymerase subunit alpha [Fimbriimonadaceae bacterium]
MPFIQTLDINQEYAKFVLEPLERGYGQTIGNALRRVLLSSIQGAAVTAIKVDKVFHEFAPIPGVKEDTNELLLNLKDLAIRWQFEGAPPEEGVIRLDVKGPGRVTGADVECPPGLSVVNPEAYIATISDPKANLTAEFYIGWGTGYVLPERHERYKGVIGIIPTGSQYTPVRKVNYTVEPTRVGMRTDYERLVLEVWTNGACAPNDAVTQAAHILDKYFRMFFELGNAGLDVLIGAEEDLAPELANVPELKIEELDFSQRTFNCLRRAGILTLRQLAAVNEVDLTSIRGFGKKSLNEVRDKLQEHGIELKAAKGGFINLDLLDDEDDF